MSSHRELIATLFHNPACSKSREALSILREHGLEVEIVDYLHAMPSPWHLHEIIARLGVRPRELVRTNEPELATLDLDLADDPAVTAALSAHPILLQRPIVLLGEHAVVARPPEMLADWLRTRLR